MTARWLRAAVGLLVLLAGAWALVWSAQGAHATAVVGAVAILLAHMPVLALEFGWMHRVNRGDAAPRARALECLSAWWSESWLGLKTFAWVQPFRAQAVPDRIPQGSQGRRGVVLVHGFMCNRGMWSGWMQQLQKLDVPCMAVTLEPTFGSIDSYVPTVEGAVQRMTQATGLAPLVVAHSMGGLAVRAWLRWRRLGPDAALPTHRATCKIITLGTPHHGTAVGGMHPALNAQQMRYHGEWVQALAASESSALSRHFICFYSHCDNIVFPASTATLPGADNRHIRAMGHMMLIQSHAVFDTVVAHVVGVASKPQPDPTPSWPAVA